MGLCVYVFMDRLRLNKINCQPTPFSTDARPYVSLQLQIF